MRGLGCVFTPGCCGFDVCGSAQPPRARKRIHRRRSVVRPRLEALEDRLAPATFTVFNLNDSGAGSLRQAIISADSAGGANTIAFDTVATTGPGLQLITLASALPTITGQVTIDGTTQPGYAGTPLIDINGNSMGGSILTVNGTAANGTDIQGLELSGYTGAAITLNGAQNVILQNLNLSEPNSYNSIGIQVLNGSDNVTISNVNASGTSEAITVQSSVNPTIQNNILSNSGSQNAALYLSGVTSLAVGAISGNNYSGDNNALRIDYGQSGLIIGNASVAGAQIVIEDGTSGMSSVTGTALFLNGSQPSLISNLQLGYAGIGRSGNGIIEDNNAGSGLTIQNVTASNRGNGIDLSGGGQDLTLTGNTLTNDNTALYLDSFTAAAPFTVPVIASGNIVTGSGNGFQLFNLGTSSNPQFIGTSGTGIIVNNASDGFQTVTGTVLYIRNLPNATISGLDLSFSGTGRSGTGIYSGSNLGTGVTIQNVNASNRGSGIQLPGGGQNLTLTGNDLSNDGTALYVDSFTAAAPFTAPVIASGNIVTGSSNGFQLFNLGTSSDPESIGTSGTSIIIDNAADGFQTVTNFALWLRNMPGVTISGVDLSYSGTGRSGVGIFSDSNIGTGATIENVNASNRSTGIQLQSGGADLTLTDNDLSNDNTGLYLDSFSTSSFTVPVIASGNTVTGDSNGFQLFNISGQYIGTSGTGIIINNAIDGFQTVSNFPLWLRNTPGLTISGLDLSYSGANRGNIGIYSDSNLGQGVTIQNVNASNRNTGIDLQGGGQDLTLTGNNLSNDNTGLYLDNFSNSSFAVPIIASGNTVTGDSNGFQLFDISGQYIGTSGTGIIVNNATDGFQTVSHYPLWLRNMSGLTVSGLDLSYSGANRGNIGIFSDGYLGQGVTIQNVNASNRNTGIDLQGGGQDLTLTGNDLANDNTGLYLDSFSTSSFPVPVIACGNIVTGDNNGFQLFNIAGQYIGTSGTGIIINNAADGFQTVSNFPLWLRNMPGLTVSGLDLSYSGSSRGNIGIFSDSNLGQGVTIQNVIASNRNTGIDLQGGGQDLTLTGNNLSSDNTGLYLDSFSTSSFPVPVIASGNTVTGDYNGFQLFNLTGQFIGTSGTGIIINNTTDGFQTVTGRALWVRCNNSTIDGVDVSWDGGGQSGRGIYEDGSTNSVTIIDVIAENRTTAIEVDGGSGISIQNNEVSNDSVGIVANNASDTTHVNQNRIVGNSIGLQAQNGGNQVDATNNFWGSASGPGAGGDDGFTGNANASPFLTTFPTGTPSSFVVDTTADDCDGDTSSISALQEDPGSDGTISLREAILAADNTPGPHVITFAIGSGAQTITLSSPLPAITGTVTIEGSSQPGYAGTPLITIDDANLGGTVLTVSGTNDVVEDLAFVNAPGTAVAVSGAAGAALQRLSLSGSGAGTGLAISGSSSVFAESLTIDNWSTGVSVASSSNVTVTASAITNNTTAGVTVDATSTGVTLNQDVFQGNPPSSAVVNNNASATVDATNNFWGAANGPSNLDGTGNGYTGNVNASPFLTNVPQWLTATTLTVNTTADVSDGNTSSIAALIANPGPDGKISLREALTALNNTPGGGTIDFAIGAGPQTITLTSDLPAISQPIVIDGTSQPGYAGTPLITINANGLGGTILSLNNASGDTVEALNVEDYTGTAVNISNAPGATVQNLDLSNSAEAGQGNGLVVGSSNNAVIQNVNASSTNYGIQVVNSSNPVVQNNIMDNDGNALTLNQVTGLAVGAVSGNNYAGSSQGLTLDGGESGLTIGNASVGGTRSSSRTAPAA